MRVIFLGTPDFAVASLKALVEHKIEVVAVVTAPDKPAGRGMNLQQSAVKKYAVEQQIPVLQPEKLKDPLFLEELKSFKADIQVVVAFRMLPEVVWNMPHKGTINVHASLLPNYRGAAPINWAIINGEKSTGVTTFKLKHQIDTGNILLQNEIPILPDDTAGRLHDKLMHLGAELIVKTLEKIASDDIVEREQSLVEEAKHAPKLFTETCKIDWNNKVESVYNKIRGLSPYPAAFTLLNNKVLKLYRTQKINLEHHDVPSSIQTDGKTFLRFACTDGYIQVDELQLEGKKRMLTADFLRGNKID